ncbi:MAG: head-tail adaptor protein [Phycisphaerales bacterium]|nr:head-tail adaptor protein [Phycisphaerales bacterium]
MVTTVPTSWTRTPDAGGLRHRVSLQRAKNVKGAAGALKPGEWVEYAYVWADCRDLTATQTFKARQAMAEVSATIKIRFRRGVEPDDRVAWMSTPIPAPSQLAAAVNNVNPILTLADVSGYPTTFPFLIRIGDEVIRVTELRNGSYTVIRGWGGTTATKHVAGSSVYPVSLRIFGVIAPRDETGNREFLLLDCKELFSAS